MNLKKITRWISKSNKEKIISISTYITDAIEKYTFERRFKMDFEGGISKKELDTEFSDAKDDATAYEPLRIKLLATIIKRLNTLGYNLNGNFIDIGSGIGRICIYCARKFKFRSVIGVEFSGPLVKIANENLSKLNVNNVKFVYGDASQYKIASGDNIIFLFNPFGASIMEKFLVFNIEHFKKSKTAIAYANDFQRNVFLDLGFKTIYRDSVLRYSIFEFP